jgi:hypothetical protein
MICTRTRYRELRAVQADERLFDPEVGTWYDTSERSRRGEDQTALEELKREGLIELVDDNDTGWAWSVKTTDMGLIELARWTTIVNGRRYE